MRVRDHPGATVLAVVVVVALIGGVAVFVVRGREPAGCTEGVPYGLSRNGYDGAGDPNEDFELVIPTVNVVARVTVVEDLVPVVGATCKNNSTPSHTVRVRVDEVLYTDLSESATPSAGDQIEVSTSDTISALSADADGPQGRQVAIIAINKDRTNRATGDRVQWLADGRSRITSDREPIRQAWEDAIAASRLDGTG